MTSTILISMPVDELQALITRCVNSCLKYHTPEQPQEDRCYLSEAIEITGLSKSQLYKLTASGGVPCKTFNSRLVFSRKELGRWVDTQTVSKHDHKEAILALAKSANKKKGVTN